MLKKENFVDYLNYERERRKELRAKAQKQVDEELAEAQKSEEIIEKHVAEYLKKIENADSGKDN